MASCSGRCIDFEARGMLMGLADPGGMKMWHWKATGSSLIRGVTAASFAFTNGTDCCGEIVRQLGRPLQ